MTAVGFIGLGLIGARRFQIVRDLGHQISFAVDPDPLRHVQMKMDGCRFAAALGELSEQDTSGVQAIFVAVPHHLAAEYCRWGFGRKAHVLCEKPMGISLAEADEIRRAASQADVRFCAGFNYRFLPGITALRDLLHSGQLGTIHRIKMAMGHGGRPGMENEWKLKKAKAGGGALIDPGIHLIDLVRNLFGEPRVVSSRLRKLFWPSDVEDNCFLALRTGESDITIEVSLTSWKNHFSIEAYGSDGQATLTGRGGNYGSQHLEFVNRWFWKDDDRRFARDYGSADPSFELETRAFLDLISSNIGNPALSTAEDGRAALKIVEELYALAD
jgi:predicted dehydrogenase